jgi:hypothetical protein
MEKRMRRWRATALVAFGVLIGIALAASPATSHVASWTHNWSAHIRPKADVRYHTKAAADGRYLPNRNLPRGTTIRGAYEANGIGPAVTSINYTTINWGRQLASQPAAHFLKVGGAPTTECPGSGTNPTALAGHLCIYEVEASNADANRGLESHPGVSRWGTGVFVTPQSDGFFRSSGVWVVSAP